MSAAPAVDAVEAILEQIERVEIAQLEQIKVATAERGQDVLHAVAGFWLEQLERSARARRYPAIGAATDGGLLAEQRVVKGGAT